MVVVFVCGLVRKVKFIFLCIRDVFLVFIYVGWVNGSLVLGGKSLLVGLYLNYFNIILV